MLSLDAYVQGWDISLWKHISRIHQPILKVCFNWLCDFIRPQITLSYVVIVTSVAWVRQGQIDNIDWQWRQALPCSIFYLWLNLERQGLSWPCVVWTRHISLHQDLSNTTSKADRPYVKMQLWGHGFLKYCSIKEVSRLEFTKASNDLFNIDTVCTICVYACVSQAQACVSIQSWKIKMNEKYMRTGKMRLNMAYDEMQVEKHCVCLTFTGNKALTLYMQPTEVVCLSCWDVSRWLFYLRLFSSGCCATSKLTKMSGGK